MRYHKIVIADSDATARNVLGNTLTRRGYQVFQSADTTGALRLARSLKPQVVVMDVNTRGNMSAYDAARIIEDHKLSTVVFMSERLDAKLKQQLTSMSLYAYILKPLNVAQVLQVIEFCLKNIEKMAQLQAQVTSLKHQLTTRKTIDRAKGMLIEKMQLNEAEAYAFLQKQSMNQSVSMEVIAQAIIKELK